MTAVPLPAKYTVTDTPVIYDQNGYPACAGYALAGCKSDEEYLQHDVKYTFDGLWLYNEAKKIDGMPNVSGTELRFVLHILQNQGVKQTGLPCTKKQPNAYWEIKEYYRIGNDSAEDFIKQVIIQFGSIVVGSAWYQSWMKVKDIFPPPDAYVGGHGYRIDGWNETGFIVPNSWGKRLWGIGGIATMPYNIFMGIVLPHADIWKLIDA